MKRIEEVYREILYQSIEKNNKRFTQREISKKLNLSLSVVNLALKPLKRMNAVTINKRSFDIVNIKKILMYWASIRNLEKDIVYKTRVNENVIEIENNMPSNIVFSAYSAYKLKFKDAVADYSEVYVYDGEDVKKRFKLNEKNPNLFVIKKDRTFDLYKGLTIAQLFVDLWNLREWYAKDYLKALEAKLNGILA